MEGGRASEDAVFQKSGQIFFRRRRKTICLNDIRKWRSSRIIFLNGASLRRHFILIKLILIYLKCRKASVCECRERKENKREGLLTKTHSIIFTWKEAFKPTSQ